MSKHLATTAVRRRWCVCDQATSRDGMWNHHVFQERQRDLAALYAKEPAQLASRLASMFQANFVIGMALGSLGLAAHKRLSARFSELSVMNKLAALAEALGAARTENPDQLRELVADGRLTAPWRARPKQAPRLAKSRREAWSLVLSEREAER